MSAINNLPIGTHDTSSLSDQSNEAIQDDPIEQKGMSVKDWTKRWEDSTKLRRWELIDVHPFVKKFAPPLQTHPSVLIPLCGKTVDIFWLLAAGYRVIGVECSPVAIQELLDEHIGNGKYTVKQLSPDCSIFSACDNRLVLVACDIFADQLVPAIFGGPISFVWDRAALSALHPIDHSRYIKKLKQLSDKNAQFLLGVYWHSGPEDYDPPFPLSNEAMNKLFGATDLKSLDELNSMNDEWVKVGYHDLCERCYRIEL